MCDFDLCDALESSTESGEKAFESHTCMFMGVHEELLSLDAELDLTDYMQPNSMRRMDLTDYSMRRIALLAVALNRMKPSRNHASTEEHMSTITIMETSCVEDSIVRHCHGQEDNRKIIFRRGGDEKYTLCDKDKKNLVTSEENQRELLATTLKGGHSSQMPFKLTRYSTPKGEMAVVLTIAQHHVCCTQQGDKRCLMLEASDLDEMKFIAADGDLNRFLFKMKTIGADLTSFESVKCPGWFISTSPVEAQPVQMVQMCQEKNDGREKNNGCEKNDGREINFKVISDPE